MHRLRRVQSRLWRRFLATHSPKDTTTTNQLIIPSYPTLYEKLVKVKRILNDRPLSLAEKILYSHLNDPDAIGKEGSKVVIRGEKYLQLKPQRVAMQDASAQ